ncbi:preprotein translocase subunit SecE [Chromatium okenii]|jgi:preprotein translocase subunit SecE|uniref:Protein translocase subunit SecE n=1 Tax=Chromatium okenii TaxID=61644 RepID=A0A2S7XT51_9GAMM|nr:preprotein translocase subunit SecE [Chromatium okenii]MBV5308970.1 preprotein translocase subunit SecE [Chromatium okenii]PQJ96658.1 preprotein translocase subunit SecE [Chromatium okenii]
MNLRTENLGVSLDTIKLTVAAFLLVLGITAFYYFASLSTLIRVIGLLIVVGAAVAIVYQTELGRLLWQFVTDSRMEVRKVVWPSRQETLQTTLVVIAMVLIVGILLWLFDMILMTILRFLTGQGG